MTPLAHIAGRIYDTPLMIAEQKAATLHEVFQSHLQGAAPAEVPTLTTVERANAALMLALPGEKLRMSDGGYLVTQDGIALVPVFGSLVQRTQGLDALSGITSYQGLGATLDAAERDPNVRGIVLEIDSPGGESSGLFELASRVRESKKRVWAQANEFAFSAAYGLGSAAEVFNVAPSGMGGSIGVITMHVDQSRMNDKRGVTVTQIFAGERKADMSPHAPLSEAALRKVQQRVDEVYGMFLESVAKDGRITADAARATEAGVFGAAEALEVGLFDGIATLTETIGQLRNELNSSQYGAPYVRRAGRAAQLGAATMPTNTTQESFTAEQLQQAQTAARAEGMAAGRTEGAQAERARIKGIATSEKAIGKPKLACSLAFNSDMTIEQAVALLADAGDEAPAAPTNALASAMAKVPNPKLGPDIDTAEPSATVRPIKSHTDIFSKRARDAKAAAQS